MNTPKRVWAISSACLMAGILGCTQSPGTTTAAPPMAGDEAAPRADRQVLSVEDSVNLDTIRQQLPERISAADAEKMLIKLDPSVKLADAPIIQPEGEKSYSVQSWSASGTTARGGNWRANGNGRGRNWRGGNWRGGGAYGYGFYGSNFYNNYLGYGYYPYGNYLFPYSYANGYYSPYTYGYGYGGLASPYLYNYAPYSYLYGGSCLSGVGSCGIGGYGGLDGIGGYGGIGGVGGYGGIGGVGGIGGIGGVGGIGGIGGVGGMGAQVDVNRQVDINVTRQSTPAPSPTPMPVSS